MKTQISLFRASVEKVYGWKEKDGRPLANVLMLGLLEIWGELPKKGKGMVEIADLSPEALPALKFLWKCKAVGWIA